MVLGIGWHKNLDLDSYNMIPLRLKHKSNFQFYKRTRVAVHIQVVIVYISTFLLH